MMSLVQQRSEVEGANEGGTAFLEGTSCTERSLFSVPLLTMERKAALSARTVLAPESG